MVPLDASAGPVGVDAFRVYGEGHVEMINDRPIDDPRLQRALDECRHVLRRYGFAGACMIVGPQEAAFFYKLDAPWSGFRYDMAAPLGFRLRINSAEDGAQRAHGRAEAAVHTVCQLSDFGEQTTAWMEDMKLAMRRRGIEFDHVPFNGRPLPHIAFGGPPSD